MWIHSRRMMISLLFLLSCATPEAPRVIIHCWENEYGRLRSLRIEDVTLESDRIKFFKHGNCDHIEIFVVEQTCIDIPNGSGNTRENR